MLTLLLVFSAHSAISGNITSNLSGGPDKEILLDLFAVATGNTESYIDGLTVRYNTGYLASTADDVDKVGKAGENIASYRELKDLSDEKKPLFYSSDTVFLHITNTAIKDYRFKILMQGFSVTGLVAKLYDNYLHTSTILNTSGGTSITNFNITTDPASADPFRFNIVITTVIPLPVTFASFKARKQYNNIALEWKVSNQISILQYEVERSVNGINFSRAAIQPAINNSSQIYNWIDTHTVTGNNFYRIRSVGIAGDIRYSSIVNVKMGSNLSDINIYPNPVTNNIIALEFTEMPKGFYNVRFLNIMGQLLYTTKINNISINSTQTFKPPVMLAKGNYYLEIVGPDNLKLSKLVSVTK